MTVQEIAELEQVSERSAQRYITVGFQGHILKGTKHGKSYHVREEDYRQWRRDCGFDTADPAPVAQVEVIAVPAPSFVEPSNLSEIAEFAEPLSMFRPANPGGPLTNVPHKDSGNWAAPETCEAYLQREARKLVEKYRGSNHEPIE